MDHKWEVSDLRKTGKFVVSISTPTYTSQAGFSKLSSAWTHLHQMEILVPKLKSKICWKRCNSASMGYALIYVSIPRVSSDHYDTAKTIRLTRLFRVTSSSNKSILINRTLTLNGLAPALQNQFTTPTGKPSTLYTGGWAPHTLIHWGSPNRHINSLKIILDEYCAEWRGTSVTHARYQPSIWALQTTKTLDNVSNVSIP